MTKKDYIKLAKAIKDSGLQSANNICNVDYFINELCGILKADNPRFDKQRFLTACK